MSAVSSLVQRAYAPVDVASLAVFRLLFGTVMVVDFARYWAAGWVDSHFVTPAFLFTYIGFEWVQPLPRLGMYALFTLLIMASVGLALGALYRVSAWVLVFGHTYLFLLSATHYLNHAYLLSVVLLLMACLPAHRGLSPWAWRRGTTRSWTPAWAPWLLQAQLSIVYVFGGIAKINPDWLAGEPVRGWLHNRAGSAVPWMADVLRSEAMTSFVTFGGLGFDLLIAPALWWRRTRPFAVLAAIGFHLSNDYLFNIGVFPWFMLAATTLFFEPDWPRRIPWLGPWIDRALGPVPEPSAVPPPPRHARAWLGVLGAWLLLQVALPLRHHLYPGNVAWTEEGHYFSWRMKLRTKSGAARFVVHAPSTGETWVVDPHDELTRRQARKMASKPDLVAQYARHLKARWQQERGLHVEVRARVWVSLNRRPRQQLIDPNVDLGAVEPSLGHATWILPGPTTPVPRSRPRRR